MNKRMRGAFLLVLLVILTVTVVPLAGAQTKPVVEQARTATSANEKQKKAVQLIHKYGKDTKGLDAALKTEGWEKATVVAIEDTSPMATEGIGTLSSGSCGRVAPKNSYRQADGTQLVTGNFNWTCGYWDGTTRPQDVLVLGMCH